MPDPATDPPPPGTRPKRSNTATSLAQSILLSDPAPGFFAATAQATSKAPTLGEIRRGSFGEDGWGNSQGSGSSVRRRPSAGSPTVSRKWSWSGRGGGDVEPASAGEEMAAVTEEPGRISGDWGHSAMDMERAPLEEREGGIPVNEKHTGQAAAPAHQWEDPAIQKAADKNAHLQPLDRATTSGYIPPEKLPWTQSTLVGLKAFGKWFITPFGFLVTLYGLNVVAWGGMLFLLLCGAAPAMCQSPIPNETNQRKLSPAQALDLPGPYYHACEDINSPKRVWIEIDSQILNALFCVTGLGLVPWRFRDLWYLMRWRLTSSKNPERKMYGLRVLAGIHRGWFRLPGTETLDTLSTREYLSQQQNQPSVSPTKSGPTSDLESATSSSLTPEHDPRLPLPLTKTPVDPITSIRSRPTAPWLLDFFIWCQVWNTFFQCCLCGFMWGMDRYDRPPWSTGLFVALACIIAGVGGVVSFVQGRKVKRVEGVAPTAGDAGVVVEGGNSLELTMTERTYRTGRESWTVEGKQGEPSDLR